MQVARPAGRRPKHQVIADELRGAILAGQYRDGDRLPAEDALMEQYRVSRATARHAVATLQQQGLAVARHGAGVFVRRPQPVYRRSPQRLARSHWSEGRAIWDVDADDREVTVDMIEVLEEPAVEHIARSLELDLGAPVLVRRRRYSIDGRPVQYAVSHIPAELATGTPIAEPDPGPGGIYARLADVGAGPTRFLEEVRSRMPTADEVRLLQLPAAGAPVLEIVRTALAGRRPVEMNQMILDAGAHVLAYAFNA